MKENDFYTSDLWKNGVKFFSELNQFVEKFPSSSKNVLGIQIKGSMATILADLAEANECDYYNTKKKILITAKGRIERIKCYLRISIESGSVSKIDAEKIAKKFDNLKMGISKLSKLKIPKDDIRNEKNQNKYLRNILNIIKDEKDGISFAEIEEKMDKNKLHVHERTLRRYISRLYDGNLITKKERGRSVFYQVIQV